MLRAIGQMSNGRITEPRLGFAKFKLVVPNMKRTSQILNSKNNKP